MFQLRALTDDKKSDVNKMLGSRASPLLAEKPISDPDSWLCTVIACRAPADVLGNAKWVDARNLPPRGRGCA